jgi:hypothetical protein
MTHTIHRDDTATRPDTMPGATRAFLLLRTVFTLAPIVFGLDKFFGLLTDWEGYLAPWINDLVPGSAHDAMLLVGVVEIVAGLAVAVRPRFGGLLVAAWLAGIIVDLVSTGEYYDIALRDAGLLVAAVSLSLLAPRAGTAVRARTRDDRAASGTGR